MKRRRSVARAYKTYQVPGTPEYVRVQIVLSFIVLLAYNQYVPVVHFLGLVEVGQPGRVLAHHGSRPMCRCLAFLSSPTYDYDNLSSSTALSSRSHFHLFLSFRPRPLVYQVRVPVLSCTTSMILIQL